MLTDQVTILYAQPLDGYAEPPATPAQATVMARVDYKRHKVLNSNGIEVLAGARVFFAADTLIGFLDKVLFDGRQWQIVSIERLRALNRVHHLEVYVI